jgi:hypothetical protein
VSLQETMVAIQNAKIGFQATLHVRSRMVQAYTDILNRQVQFTASFPIYRIYAILASTARNHCASSYKICSVFTLLNATLCV